jgi:hypothetical protein
LPLALVFVPQPDLHLHPFAWKQQGFPLPENLKRMNQQAQDEIHLPLR